MWCCWIPEYRSNHRTTWTSFASSSARALSVSRNHTKILPCSLCPGWLLRRVFRGCRNSHRRGTRYARFLHVPRPFWHFERCTNRAGSVSRWAHTPIRRGDLSVAVRLWYTAPTYCSGVCPSTNYLVKLGKNQMPSSRFIGGLGSRYPSELLRSAVHRVESPWPTERLHMLTTITVYNTTTWHRNTISPLGHSVPSICQPSEASTTSSTLHVATSFSTLQLDVVVISWYSC